VQQVEVAFTLARRRESQPGDESKQQYENSQRNPVHFLHECSPVSAFLLILRWRNRRLP
jgi:hypothetical protein